MKPAFTEKDLKLFNKYINISTNYFEFGSGGSTHLESNQNLYLLNLDHFQL